MTPDLSPRVRLERGKLYRVWRPIVGSDESMPVDGILETWDTEEDVAWLTLKDGSEITPRLDELEAL